MRTWPWTGALSIVLLSSSAIAQTDPSKEPAKSGGSGYTSAPGDTVYTYFGLRNLERREDVPDEEKMKEWDAFIKRSEEQVAYAKKQVIYWKNAARLRIVESIQSDDKDPGIEASVKIAAWQRVLTMFPKTEEARIAEKRIAFWKATEVKRLVEAAEVVEQSQTSKLERIRAWKSVIEFDVKGPAAKGAQKRIDALQKQMYDEAKSLDKIARIDNETKLAMWRDVLAGEPTPQMRREAEARTQALGKQ